MPETTWGIWYPASTDSTRLWEHFQQLAESVNDTVIPPIYSSRGCTVSPTFTPGPTYSDVSFDADNGSQNITYNGTEWVIQYAGRYQVSTTLTWVANDDGYRGISFSVNGVKVRFTDQKSPTANNFSLSLSASITLAVGDVLLIGARTSADTGDLDLTGDPQNNFTDITYTGRAI